MFVCKECNVLTATNYVLIFDPNLCRCCLENLCSYECLHLHTQNEHLQVDIT